MKKVFIVHYHEIALKGKNRDFFVEKLITDLREKTKKFDVKIEKKFDRVLIRPHTLSEGTNFKNKANKLNNHKNNSGKKEGVGVLPNKNNDQIKEILEQTFGIAYFALGVEISSNIKDIEKGVFEILGKKTPKTFALRARRNDKSIKFTSKELEREIGGRVCLKTGASVDLNNAELTIYVEIGHKKTYVYSEKTQGLGGMPRGSAGKVVCLLSAGIDSPVATFLAAKRGAVPILVHFYSAPYTDDSSLQNVKKIKSVLEKYCGPLKLYSFAIGEEQKRITLSAPSKYLVLLYRRLMLKKANEIAKKERALGVVTGDSLGQVASQTLENMQVVSQASKLPIYRPLISFDKQEIINIAEKLGTYKISIQKHQDCCTLFTPKTPVIKGSLKEVLEIEKSLEI